MKAALDGEEVRDAFLAEIGFTSQEIERVRAIRARPRSGNQGKRNDLPFYLPRHFSEYTQTHKRLYAQCFGVAAAEIIWGKGNRLSNFNDTKET
jgi:hypothetical protein